MRVHAFVRSEAEQKMKRLILWTIVPIVIVASALAYWLGPDVLATQTLTIANKSERAVTVTVYDVDADPGETRATPGYLTSGMAQCHVITIGEIVDYASGLDDNCEPAGN